MVKPVSKPRFVGSKLLEDENEEKHVLSEVLELKQRASQSACGESSPLHPSLGPNRQQTAGCGPGPQGSAGRDR